MAGRQYRADQVGSLLRPRKLLEARAAHAEGRLGRDELRAIEDEAILAALAMQRAVGIDVYVDGELRRASFLTEMSAAVEGFVPEHVELHWRGPGGGAEGSTSAVVGARLRQVRSLAANELPFLQQHAPGPFKITLPAPSNFMLVGYKPGVTDQFYASREELTQELVGIVRREIESLVAAGVPYIQLDAPFYMFYVDPQTREGIWERGVDPDQALEAAIAADRACLEGIARGDSVLGIHICRGNSRSRWVTEGGYDTLAEPLFGSLPVDALLLEYDSERAGTFEPLRFVPGGTTVVLGLVTTKSPELESVDLLRRRIDEAARYVPLENLSLSPQCGFASVAAGNLLTEDDERRKLALVVETARQVWG